jgi:Neutral/alkaline non-lysosomal ceramidase, N-terminal
MTAPGPSRGGGFRAGVGRATITPPFTVPHAGWGAQTHLYAEGVETDLWATVLVLADSQEMAAVVDVDLVAVTPDDAQAIRAEVARVLGVASEKVRVTETHNHAGPPPSTWAWMKEGTGALRRYYEQLPDRAASAAMAALRRLRPARAAAGAGESRVAVNRREKSPDGRMATGVNPDGIMDPQVFVLRIDGQDEQPLAAIVGYTAHPTTMGPTNRCFSADWPGHLKRTVEAITGATCLFAQGATGNVGPGPEGFTDDPRVIRKIGGAVGSEAARVYFGLSIPPKRFRHERVWESGAPLGKWTGVPESEPEPRVRVMTRDLPLPLRPQPPVADAEAEAEAARRRLNDLVDRRAPAQEIEAATFVTKRAAMTLARSRAFAGKSELPIELHLLQIGPAVLAGIPAEPFVEIGLAIKSRSPFPHTWFGGYVGGWSGYIPMPEEYPRGGYEVETSPYTPDAAGRVVDGTVAALKDLRREETAR